MKITQKTTLGDLLKEAERINEPRFFKTLQKHKVPCLFCPMAEFEMKKLEIGRVCKMYGLDFKKIREELEEVVLKNQKGRKLKRFSAANNKKLK